MGVWVVNTSPLMLPAIWAGWSCLSCRAGSVVPQAVAEEIAEKPDTSRTGCQDACAAWMQVRGRSPTIRR